jgi:hypothetical protein
MRLPPLLRSKFHKRAAVFTPENLLREARRQKRIAKGRVPEICVLDPDGDLVRHLRRTGAAVLGLLGRIAKEWRKKGAKGRAG